MYGTTFDMSDEAMDPNFQIPLGKAKIEREGNDSIRKLFETINFAS